MSYTRSIDPAAERLMEAALAHVPFDGWSDATFRAACDDAGIAPDQAKLIAPRGAVDLAVLHHRVGDRDMAAAVVQDPMTGMKFRDKVARALVLRLEAVQSKEAVQRATTLFALPHLAPTSAGLIWETADTVWNALGDSSQDVNWYTKRATLSGVWGSTVLYWLGDEDPEFAATREFIDRRIDNVMQFEKLKADVNNHPVLGRLVEPLGYLTRHIRAPMQPPPDLPGQWK